jgi:quinol monooxygenase YgiN
MVHLLAFITAHAGKRAELLAAFHDIIPTVHAEDGCIEYAPVVDIDGFEGFTTPLGPDTYAVVEKWASADALRRHAAQAHMVSYNQRVKPLIAERVLHVLTPG